MALSAGGMVEGGSLEYNIITLEKKKKKIMIITKQKKYVYHFILFLHCFIGNHPRMGIRKIIFRNIKMIIILQIFKLCVDHLIDIDSHGFLKTERL